MASTDDRSILNSKSEADAGVAYLLRSRLQNALTDDANKSLFRQAIDLLSSPYHKQDLAIKDLNELSMKESFLSEKGFINGNNPELKQEVREAVRRYQAAGVRESDAYSVLGGAVKTLGLLIPGASGYFLSGLSFALDEHTGGAARLDLLQGMSKGVATKYLMSNLTGAQLSAPVQALGLGVGARFIDASLSRKNYLTEAGRMNMDSLESGVKRVLASTFDPVNVSTDLATLGLAVTVLKPFQGILAENARLRLAGVAAIYGFSGGMAEEAARQSRSGELDLLRLAAFPAAKALSSAAFSYPAGSRLAGIERLQENRVKTIDMEYRPVSILQSQLRLLSANGDGSISLKLRPLGADGKLQGEQDFLVQPKSNSAALRVTLEPVKEFRARESAGTNDRNEIRFIYRDRKSPDSPWQLQLRAPGERPVQELLQTPSTFMRTFFYFRGNPPGLSIEGLSEPARRVLGSGMQSVAIEMANGGVLKLSKGVWEPEWGQRPFDARLLSPLTQFKAFNGQPDSALNLYVQESVTPARFRQYTQASEQIEKGRVFRFSDPKPAQVGRALRADGEHTVLIDYGSVIRR